MCKTPRLTFAQVLVTCLLSVVAPNFAVADSAAKIENPKLMIEANEKDSTYTVRSKDNPRVWFTASAAAQVNHRWLHAADYPQHEIQESPFSDGLGSGSQLTITYSGLSGQPELVCSIRLRTQATFAEI